MISKSKTIYARIQDPLLHGLMDTMTDHWGGPPQPTEPAIADEQPSADEGSEAGASDPGEREKDAKAMDMLQASRACLEAQREAVLILGIIHPSFTRNEYSYFKIWGEHIEHISHYDRNLL